MTACLKNSRALSRLSQLMPELIRHIFEYDDTYKDYFQKNVLLDIWKTSWQNWHGEMTCPYKQLVADWLLTTWGVYNNPLWEGESQEWCRKHYHTSDITIITRFVDVVNNDDDVFTFTQDSEEIVGEEDNYRCLVQVYMKHGANTSVIFAGEILTRKQYTADCQKENHHFEYVLDVHSNREAGLYLYQHMN